MQSLPPVPGRRSILLAGLASLLPAAESAAPLAMSVWKSPTCGCCADWVKHIGAVGIRVLVHDTGNNAARARLGMPARFGSCHTAEIEGYVIEGHVPAREVLRLLKEKPRALGLAVSGMPVGSPGMDGAVYGDRKDPYDVLLVARDGSAQTYQRYPP